VTQGLRGAVVCSRVPRRRECVARRLLDDRSIAGPDWVNALAQGDTMTTSQPSSPMAQPTSPADAARELFAALNARDYDHLARLQHEDVVDDFIVLGPVRGRPAVRKFFEDLFAACPDTRLEVVRVTSAGDMAVLEWVSRGTFTGSPFQGIEATGKRITIRGVDCMRFEEGRLKHNTIYYDGASFARQVGLLPVQGSAAEKVMTTAFNVLTKAKRALRA